MKILVLSDLHLEFHLDGGLELCRILSETRHDVAVVAGDLCNFRTMRKSLCLLSAHFREVVYVIGNHECYGGSVPSALRRARRICASLPNVHLLEDEILELGGRRFVGCTLWFRYPPSGPAGEAEWAMNDFEYVRRIREDVGPKNRASVRFLEDTVRPGDVVVTHHLPGPSCVHPTYAGHPINRFFFCDVERVLGRQRPALWIHGHTHESMDHRVRGVRVVCNPFGYLMTSRGPDVNPSFSCEKVLEL